ncbi:amino acid adenylation domain-containing protein [Streptomyces sp. NPDC002643]
MTRTGDTSRDVDERIQQLSPARRALLERLMRQRGTAPAQAIVRRSDSGKAPLSFAQQRLWFLDELEPGTPHYNVYEAVHMAGRLDVTALEAALDRLLTRHEVLRTVFESGGGEPVQVVGDAAGFGLPVVDLSGEGDPQAVARERAVREARRPFDLEQGPLFRAVLLRLGELEHVLLVTMHHIVSDGWSLGVLVGELTALYGAFAEGRTDPLPELPVQYADYAVWQRDHLRGEAAEHHLTYWRRQLADAPDLLDLPADRPAPARPTRRGRRRSFVVDAELTAALREVGQQERATPFMVLLSAFKVLLSRYSGQNDICVGTPVAGRSRAETEGLIGFFVNTLVLRSQITANASFRELLRDIREVTLNAYEHQELPFERLVEELRPVRDPSRTPLFQVMFILQNAPVPPVELPGLRLQQLPIDNNTAKFDLTLSLTEAPDGSINGAVEYSEDRFDADRIDRLTEHYLHLLRGVVATPDVAVARLGILPPTEHADVVRNWNDTATDWGPLGHVPEQIARQAAATPHAQAVIAPDGRLTYRELDERAGRLARWLRERGVRRGAVVGVCLERSVDLVVTLVAVQRAGAAYLPLDPDYPQERLTLLTADARAAAVVVRPGALAEVFSAVTASVPLTPGWERTADGQALPPVEDLRGEDLAYVIYTSGSTGAPKGVLSTHEGLRNRLAWMQRTYDIGPDDRVLQKTPFTFDVSVWEFFWPLLTGACVVLAEPGRHREPGYIVDLVRREGVTVLHFVPSMLGPFLEEPHLDACGSLRHVMCSGEALPAHLVTRFAERLDARLHNLYGPTEASIDVTAWECDPQAVGGGVPIGRPIANTRIHLLDAWLAPVPVGVPGELYIGGAGLARGYLDRPGLTADRFVPDPFSDRPGARLYRTGDRARHRSDGTIEYLDRVDRQVKIRGFRIEPGETETALAGHPGVGQAVVTVAEAADGHRTLVGYVLPAADTATPPADELRDWLRRRLPEHLVPTVLVPLDELPLTASGKLDRSALPAPDHTRPRADRYTAPRTATERLLAMAWSEVLGQERVGIDDNFFSLGGDSIRSVQVLSRLRAEGLTPALQQLFDHQTVRELAHALASGGTGTVEDIPSPAPFALIHAEDRARVPEEVEDAYPLSALQAGMVFDAEFDDSFAIYHDVFSYHLAGRFDRAALESALDLLVARHPVLRTSVHRAGFREPLQLVHRSAHVPLEVEDLRGTDERLREEAVREWARAERVRPFSWETPPLLRCQVHLRDEDSFHFSLSCHNVILDGWSLASLLTELFRTYVTLLDHPGAHASVAPASAFRDFVALERETLDSAEARSFWAEELADADFTPLPRWTEPGRSAGSIRWRSTRRPVPGCATSPGAPGFRSRACCSPATCG